MTRPTAHQSARLPAVRGPITQARRRTFLEVLAATGSFATAARTASPGRAHQLGPASSFRALMQRDPEFLEAVRAAEELATARLEEAAMRRAVDGVDRPVYQNGRLVGHEKVFSDHLLVRLLEARDPARYGPKSKLELSGHVNSAHVGLQITPQDLLLLDDRLRVNLEEILEVLVQHRGEQPQPAAPILIEADG